MKKYNAEFPIPVHPGEILQEILVENNISQTQLARHLKMDVSKINEICRGRRGISVEMAILLGKVFGQSTQLWINLQKNWELSQVDMKVYEKVKPLKLHA